MLDETKLVKPITPTNTLPVTPCQENTIQIESKELKILRNFVDINDSDLKIIISNLNDNKEKIQLLDYLHKLGLTKEFTDDIIKIQNQAIPPERLKYFEKYKKLILSLRTVDHNLSLLRLNPFTAFEKHPPLFFGMGGGSKELCKGLPFDVLSMLLTAEKFKRELSLSECRVLLANRITYTNIPKNPEFSEKSIDNVMSAEKYLMQLAVNKFQFSNWKIFLQTDIEEVVGSKVKKEYEELIREADKTSFVGGHHYSIEMADILSLVGQEHGGIKLGWFMRNLDEKNGGYIMDEQPFHTRFNLFMALRNMPNNVTLSYANAGARLYSGKTGALEKESPYICYQRENRLLLSPFEDVIKKMGDATKQGGGFEYKYYRTFLSGIISLFEELVLGKDEKGDIKRIPFNKSDDFKCSDLAQKIEYIQKYIFSGKELEEAKDMWASAFVK